MRLSTSAEILLVALATAPFWSAVLGHLKGAGLFVLNFLKGLVFTEVELDGDLGKILAAYLPTKYKSLNFPSPKTYVEGRHFVRPVGKFMSVLFRNREYNDSVYLIGRWPILVSGRASVVDNNLSYSFPFKLRYLFHTIDHEALLRNAQEAYEAVAHHEGSRFIIRRIFGNYQKEDEPGQGNTVEVLSGGQRFHSMSELVPVGFEPEELGQPQSRVALSRLYLTPEVEDLIEEVRFWHQAKEWHEERGIPWRRGYLLKGPPGTGKTSLVRAIAEELDLPIYSLDLASMDNGELTSNWDTMAKNAPVIVLLEDLDAVFHGRENVANKANGVTFDCLLNCLDGASPKPGVLCFITTNHPDKIDPALSAEEAISEDGRKLMPTRPSRIDRSILISGCDAEGRYKLALRILRDEEKARRVAEEGAGDTPAQLLERAIRKALAELFDKRKTGWKPPVTKSNGQQGSIVVGCPSPRPGRTIAKALTEAELDEE